MGKPAYSLLSLLKHSLMTNVDTLQPHVHWKRSKQCAKPCIRHDGLACGDNTSPFRQCLSTSRRNELREAGPLSKPRIYCTSEQHFLFYIVDIKSILRGVFPEMTSHILTSHFEHRDSRRGATNEHLHWGSARATAEQCRLVGAECQDYLPD